MTEEIISFNDLKKSAFEKDLENYKNSLPIFVNIDGIISALQDAYIRSRQYEQCDINKSQERMSKGLEPNPCFNLVCQHCVESDENFRTNYCDLEYNCHSCSFQMLEEPPNSLNYGFDEMPTHKQALDILEHEGIIKGRTSEWVEECRKYANSKAPNNMLRRTTEIQGISMETLESCIVNAFLSYIESEYVPKLESDILNEWGVRIASQSCLEVEKAMGIYPNIKL